jgi:2'-hydroxyisoflavone reductase
MDILLIGGPRFVGRALIDAALAGGHHVTMFNRGRTNPHAYPQVERLQGDRDGGLEPLRGRRFDAVIDTCGYTPRIVRQSAELLAPTASSYVFISTISVYAEPVRPGANEDAPLAELTNENVEEVTNETYGPLKVRCEQVVQEICGPRSLIVRPGLIVGPHDPTNRFTYWVTRVAAGGQVLAPDDRDAPVQFIDVRDLAAWTLHMVTSQATGVFNATGPAEPLTLGTLLQTCRETTESDAEFVLAPPAWLQAQGVAPWSELPLWVAGDDALNQVSIARAHARGLTFRPLAVTIADTLAWAQAEGAAAPQGAALTPAREAQLLAAYRQSAT